HEVAAGDEVEDVAAGLIGAGDPAGAVDDAGVEEIADLRRRFEAEDRVVEVVAGPDVALDALGVGGEVLGWCGLEIDLAVAEHAGAGGPVEVDLTVTGQADDDDLAGPVRMSHGADDVLQRIGGGPFAVLPRMIRVRRGHEGL